MTDSKSDTPTFRPAIPADKAENLKNLLSALLTFPDDFLNTGIFLPIERKQIEETITWYLERYEMFNARLEVRRRFHY